MRRGGVQKLVGILRKSAKTHPAQFLFTKLIVTICWNYASLFTAKYNEQPWEPLANCDLLQCYDRDGNQCKIFKILSERSSFKVWNSFGVFCADNCYGNPWEKFTPCDGDHMRNLEDLMGNLIGSKNLASCFILWWWKQTTTCKNTTNRNHFLNLDPKISVVVEPEPWSGRFLPSAKPTNPFLIWQWSSRP